MVFLWDHRNKWQEISGGKTTSHTEGIGSYPIEDEEIEVILKERRNRFGSVMAE